MSQISRSTTVFVTRPGRPPTAGDAASTLARIPKPAEERDDYDRNIQVADLNALNAMFAIGRWKRYLGFYADGAGETFAVYSIYTNDVTNEEA